MKFINKLNLNIKIIVGVPSHSLVAALELIEFCNNLPITGYLITIPIHTKPGIIGQTKWFEALLEKSQHSAILYNIPSRAGVKLHNETVQNLSKHPKFLATKDSAGSINSVIEYKIIAPNISIYCGDDYLIPAMATVGAIGLISVASNAWTEAVRNYVKKSLNEKIKNYIDKIWWEFSKALCIVSNPIPIKALLKKINYIKYDKVHLPLCREDLKSLDNLIYFYKKINMLEEINN